ncbi:2-amino-3,7-dideoxy-D-threo-hept-6-ulosonate synthase [Amycolatopsis minnesotensis]|uniref:2-amino-3,7-dideoxy-D-threo-hept-6-ulosonate synthase n=1 Tax=Amycolatopsis minnesotensis TaxID=337894 RepID=A0ABN2PZP6_9PSEU
MLADGKSFRLRRLSLAGDGRYLFVPLDHSVSDGPVTGRRDWAGLIRSIVAGGADAVVVHKGRARTIPPDALGGCALIVHLSAGTVHAADVDAKVLVGDVERAVGLGADAVSVHVNIGSDTEARQLADLGAVADACDRWHMPLLAMIYPRGPRITDPRDPVLLSHVVNIATDLGADLVKTSTTVTADRMAEVVDSCPIPVLGAGGPPDAANVVAYGAGLMLAGCAGLAVGRRVFSAADPTSVVARLAAVVHAGPAESGEVPHPTHSSVTTGVA